MITYKEIEEMGIVSIYKDSTTRLRVIVKGGHIYEYDSGYKKFIYIDTL